MINYLILLGFAIVLFLMILYFMSRDKQNNRKFNHFEKIIENLIQENHRLSKQILKPSNENLEEQMKICIDELLSQKILPILQSVQSIENIVDEFQNNQQNRINTLEERTRDLNKISAPDTSSQEEQILRLYRSGKSAESIAKDLRMSVGSVNFVLKMQGI